MRVPFLSLQNNYQAYATDLDDAVKRVLGSGWYILGKEVDEFEKAFAAWCEASHAIGVGNGTDAIALALRSLGVGAGDKVVTVSHTAVATVTAIEMTGAQPILVDIDPASFTIDPVKLEATLGKLGGKAKAVIAVHLYGHACDLISIKDICDRYGALLIEDCAQAHGAMLNGKKVGSFGAAAAFSFYPTKNLGAFGDAGAVVTSDAAVARNCAALRQYGWHDRYFSDTSGVNSRLDELQAAMLSVKLKHLDNEIMARQRIAARYNSALAGLVETPRVSTGVTHAYHLYVVRSARRESLAGYLKARGIGTAIHYPAPVHRQKAYEGRVLLGEGGMDETEKASAEILSLPLHPFLSDLEQDAVIAAIRSF